ncbi:arginase family protein [Amycolatopsis kentuckyensis]|uniref:arginase family protein n=1 Tax=Amycolatopsis kentuckyensis TaxID=218823 RepID=UPI000A3B32A1|nr:arginase family protein [Amycolatopsis kentuckyensis]
MTIVVPYHQDERLPDSSIPLPGAAVIETVEATLPDGDVWTRLVALFDVVADRVTARLGAQEAVAPVVVSGDCLVVSATITGAQRAGLDPSVVWFDAHGDVHTLRSSTSGYLGGMALRLVLGAHEERFAAPLGLRPLTERQAVLVDARDLDPAEVDYLAGSGVRRHGVEDLQAAMLPGGPLVLHIDVDVISTDELPGMRFPAPNGPTRRAVLDAARRVLATGRVIAVDIACPWHPARDEQDTATRTGLLTELLAAARAGAPR